MSTGATGVNKALLAAINAGNVNVAGAMQVEVMDLSIESRREQEQHAQVMMQYETQKRARTIIVPTAVEEVKLQLRELGQPVTLFGEGPFDRRVRLKEVIAGLQLREEESSKLQGSSSTSAAASSSSTAMETDAAKSGAQKELFYSPATPEMIEARKVIAEFSFARALERLSGRKRVLENEALVAEETRRVGEIYSYSKEMMLNSSAASEDRPLMNIRYSPNGRFLATGSLSCSVKIWDADSLVGLDLLRGHEERITALSWHSRAFLGGGDGPCLLASASSDGSCILWDCRNLVSAGGVAMDGDGAAALPKSTPLSRVVHRLVGHRGTVADCAFHLSGRFVATAGHDYSWRFWDVETAKEILLQDGHVKECCSVAMHGDGSLLLSGDGSGVVLLWDLRSGQMIQAFQGHVKKITASDFNPNGYQAATSSVDNIVRIWDLRKKKCSYVLPAHSNAITDVKYSSSGEQLLTSSFDGSIKTWRTRDNLLLNTLQGHANKVMSADFSPDERRIASAGFDKTVKLWAHKAEF